MRLSDALSLSTRIFKTRPLRTFLTILGVSVGIGAVLFLVSLGYGLQRLILNQITTADSLLSLDVTSGAGDIIDITDKEIEEINMINEVVEVSPSANLSAQFSINEYTGDCLAYVVDPSFFRLSGLEPDYGELFQGDNGEHKVVISSLTAQLFGMEPEEILNKDAYLTLYIPTKNEEGFEELRSFAKEESYKVVGVINDENSNYIFVPAETVLGANIVNYDQLKVKVANNDSMSQVRDEIIAKGFLVSSLSETIDQANKIFRVVQIILALFGLVALTVSAIGMFNTMTIALLERINEIGIMRAIGVTKTDIRYLFLFESVIMGFLGGVGGVLVGYLGGEIANFGLNVVARAFGGASLDLFYQPLWFVIFIIVFSTVIGFATGLYPSRRAARINPLVALRYK